ncbi:MAG TPA: flagellar basal body-associated FliL family protein [bacterium]|nr:flagellar basal body-associated FliL family protein [bacterium]
MEKIKSILKFLPRVALIIGALVLVGVNLATAYIMFAPDSLPKPFYLMYQVPNPETETDSNDHSSNPEEEEPPSTNPDTEEVDSSAPTPIVEMEIIPGQGIMVDTGAKIVNINPTGRKLLRVGVVLEFAPAELEYYTMLVEEKEAYAEVYKEEINERLPVINDILISLLSSQTFESTYTALGKEILRQQIADTINQQIPEYQVIFVYFTEFVVQ